MRSLFMSFLLGFLLIRCLGHLSNNRESGFLLIIKDLSLKYRIFDMQSVFSKVPFLNGGKGTLSFLGDRIPIC